MAKYTAQVMVNRPTFLHIELEAADPDAAYARVSELVDSHLGFKRVEEFDELIGESEGTIDGFEILDIEETR